MRLVAWAVMRGGSKSSGSAPLMRTSSARSGVRPQPARARARAKKMVESREAKRGTAGRLHKRARGSKGIARWGVIFCGGGGGYWVWSSLKLIFSSKKSPSLRPAGRGSICWTLRAASRTDWSMRGLPEELTISG